MSQVAEFRPAAGSAIFFFVALSAALLGVAGSLYLSLGMGLKACPLCLYQRSLVMSAAMVLVLALLAVERERLPLLMLLALAPALAGLAIAGYHVYLVYIGKLECPRGALGAGSAPQQSLAMFAVLVLALAGGVLQGGGRLKGSLSAALALGLLAGYGAVKSAPPPPPAPKQPYEIPIDKDGCRSPFVVPGAPTPT